MAGSFGIRRHRAHMERIQKRKLEEAEDGSCRRIGFRRYPCLIAASCYVALVLCLNCMFSLTVAQQQPQQDLTGEEIIRTEEVTNNNSVDFDKTERRLTEVAGTTLAEGSASTVVNVQENSGLIKSLDDRLLDLQLKIENDLNKVEEDAKVSAAITSENAAGGGVIKSNVVDAKYVKKDSKRDRHGSSVEKKGEIVEKHKDTGAKQSEESDVALVSKGQSEQNLLRLAEDLAQVRTDISTLLQTVTEAEWELERTKAKLSSEERVILQKSVEIETEKMIDDLHKGKLKVDYVTGELLAAKENPDEKDQPAKTETGDDPDLKPPEEGNTSENVVPASADEETSGDQSGGASGVSDKNESVVLHKEEPDSTELRDTRTSEKSIDAIIDAATSDLRNSNSDVSASLDPPPVTSANEGNKANGVDSIVRNIELRPDLKTRVKEEIELLRTGSDPAVMSIDMQLLLDVVTLAITAALFGLVAVFLRLPPTAGFLLGGMLIGPSCWDLIQEIRQVQTLAQFGSIFLLFEQGLLYSQTYTGAAVMGSALATGLAAGGTGGNCENKEERNRKPANNKGDENCNLPPTGKNGISSNVHMRRGEIARKSSSSTSLSAFHRTSSSFSETEHNANVVGIIILVLLVFSALTIFISTNTVTSVPEAIIVSTSVALCSTTIVSENLHAAHIANTGWGKGVLKMIAIHDLFMVPLLALPEMIESVNELFEEKLEPGDDDGQIESVTNTGSIIPKFFFHLLLVAVFLKGSLMLARHVINAAMSAETRMMGDKGDLFTLSIVAYALLMATVSEELKLSIEAGAVFAGIVLMRSRHVPKILSSIQPITSVFGGMYLTSLGMIISPSFVISQAGPILKLVVFIGFFKLTLVSTVLNRFFDYGITSSLAVGSAMAQISEISLLVMAKAQRLGLMNRSTYLVLIPTTCILLTLAPFSTAHLRRLKVQEITGNDDGRIPFYLCFLRSLSILRHPQRRAMLPLHSRSGDELDMEQHRTLRT